MNSRTENNKIKERDKLLKDTNITIDKLNRFIDTIHSHNYQVCVDCIKASKKAKLSIQEYCVILRYFDYLVGKYL